MSWIPAEMSLRYDLSIKTTAELREEGHALARSCARWKQNQTPNTHKGARACLVSSSYPGSCSESLGLPEVTWLASASIAQSPTNSKHTHTHTHTHGHCSPSSRNITEPGALASHVGSARAPAPLRRGRGWERQATNPAGICAYLSMETTPPVG